MFLVILGYYEVLNTIQNSSHHAVSTASGVIMDVKRPLSTLIMTVSKKSYLSPDIKPMVQNIYLLSIQRVRD